MKQDPSRRVPASPSFELTRCLWASVVFAAVLSPAAPARLLAQMPSSIGDITGRYHFIGPDDTLAILEEEGRLKGFVEVYQEEDESDAVLSYTCLLYTSDAADE